MARKANDDSDRARPDAPTSDVDAAAEWFARRDAGLTDAEEVAFQRWLSADPRNRDLYAEVESAWLLFGKPPGAGEKSQLGLLLERRASGRRKRRITVGAAIIAVLLITTLATWPSFRTSDRSPVAKATIMSPSRQTLPDGTVVLLKEGASVRETYSAAYRRVELTRGEAMFEVRKDPSRPFIVRAGGVEVRAVGTAFSVQLDRSRIEVVIAEGTVAIATPPAPDARSHAGAAASHDESSGSAAAPATPGVLVKAGNRVLIRGDNHGGPEVTPLAEKELHERLAWRQPRVEFSNTPLREAVDLLNREAGSTRLVIADPELDAVRISGIFRTEQLDSFVLLLEAGFSVRAERSADAIRLYRTANLPKRAVNAAN